MLALFLGLIVSAGLYFAYMWPSIEPLEEPAVVAGDSAAAAQSPERDPGHDDDDKVAARVAKPDEPAPSTDEPAPSTDEPSSAASAPS